MANNPVQVILNESDYIVPPEPGKGGPPHDFFAGRDADFVKHRNKLAGSMRELAAQLAAKSTGSAGYIRVKLRDRAVAKTHRPIHALLTSDKFPCVGAAGPGELFYFAEGVQLAQLSHLVMEAEPDTSWVENAQGHIIARPTLIRSEVGAIEDIAIPDPIEKRRFDAHTAVEWLSDPRTGGFYLVELFENPAVAQRRLPETDTNLSKSLEALLSDIGAGVVAWRLPEAGGETPIALKLTDGAEPALLSSSRPASATVARIDQRSIRHETALQRLAQHPSVRRISLPLRLELSDVSGAPMNGAIPLPRRSATSRYPKVAVVDSGLGPAFAEWKLGRHDFLQEDEVDGNMAHLSVGCW